MPTDDTGTGSLLILWTSGDRETALNMALMYGLNARLKDWWQEVTLLIWGASQSLAVEDAEVREKVAEMTYAGVRVTACRKCAENLGLKDRLTEMGCEVFYAGEFLTDWLKSGRPILTV
ncbi:MAG: DsrE family protein [Actinomycetota bacterium]